MECPFKDPGLNRGEVESVAALNSSLDEIAAYFDTSEDVIIEFYMNTVQKGWGKGKIKIRQMLMDKAEKEPKVLDFLAKNFIGGEGGKR